MPRAVVPARPAASGLRAAAAGAIAAAAARGAYAVLRRYPPAGAETWTRTNHRGEPVTLLEGPAVAAGAITVAAVAGAAPGRPGTSPAVIAVAGAGALGFGVIDDLAGSDSRRGLRGHLGALARGEITTGTVKLAGLAATGLACAALASRARAGTPGRGGPVASAADAVINAGLIAGGANLINLFDLRPGRAIKVVLLSGGMIAAASALPRGTGPGEPGTGLASAAGLAGVAAPCGAAVGLLTDDLRERAMLGDAGANALGAMLGAAAATSLSRPARATLLAGITGLTLASEKVSFTRVIERTPPLRWLDMLGRRAPSPAAIPAAVDPTGLPVVPGPGRFPAVIPRRRPGGRHRRVNARECRVRSGEWLAEFLKKPARREP